MESIVRRIFIRISTISIIFISCIGSNNETGKFSFAVFSDIHYEKPNYNVSEYFVKPFADEINKKYPEIKFVAQTGDFIHGGKGKSEDELNFVLKDFNNKVKRPLYIAKGNHDRFEKYGEITIPIFSKELNKTILTTYYSFDYQNSHFIFLDCTVHSPEPQFKWLIDDLNKTNNNRKIKHIFVFSHYPLWIVARAGFTDKSYAERLISIFSKYEIDAFFCGHTHNQTTSARILNNKKITQLMSCAVVEKGRLKTLVPYFEFQNDEKPEFIPLENAKKILIPNENLCYYWGYIEGGPSGYFIIEVYDNKINVKFCSPSRGIIREFYWEKEGEIFDIIKPKPLKEEFISRDDFEQIESVDFYYSYWLKDQIDAPIILNGKEIGKIKQTASDSRWWNSNKIEINPKHFSIIKPENEIIIKNPKKNLFGVAHCLLRITTKSGKKFNSSISEYAYLSCKKENINDQNLPDLEILKTVNLREDLYPIKLRFHIK